MRERCRLLERLQQRVLRLVVHAVGLGDHEHAALRLERAKRGLAHDLRADVVDEHVVRAPRLDPGEVRMDAGQHAPLGVGGIRRRPREMSAAANARAASRLPVPGGPWKR